MYCFLHESLTVPGSTMVVIVSLVPGGLLGSSACEDDIGTD